VKKTIVDAGNPGPGLGRAQKCVRVKPINEIPLWIIITISEVSLLQQFME
jgi:hypothetical protein